MPHANALGSYITIDYRATYVYVVSIIYDITLDQKPLCVFIIRYHQANCPPPSLLPICVCPCFGGTDRNPKERTIQH